MLHSLSLKPVDMALGNHKIFFGLNNRGSELELSLRTISPVEATNDPLTAADFDGNLFLQLGYTIVDAGWQGDVNSGNHRLRPNLPVAKQADGSAIIAPIRIEYSDRTIPKDGTFTMTLEGSANFASYPTADMNTAHCTLTVRDRVSEPKKPIPSDAWAFGTCPDGKASIVPDGTHICLFTGFRADKLYELIYPAKDPIVMGLGYAVPRDLTSFLHARSHTMTSVIPIPSCLPPNGGWDPAGLYFGHIVERNVSARLAVSRIQ